jgi:hypothetical protein
MYFVPVTLDIIHICVFFEFTFIRLQEFSTVSSDRNGLVYAGIPYRNFFLFLNYIPALISILENRSSVRIVSGYGLDDLAIDIRSPAEAKVLFL